MSDWEDPWKDPGRDDLDDGIALLMLLCAVLAIAAVGALFHGLYDIAMALVSCPCADSAGGGA